MGGAARNGTAPVAEEQDVFTLLYEAMDAFPDAFARVRALSCMPLSSRASSSCTPLPPPLRCPQPMV